MLALSFGGAVLAACRPANRPGPLRNPSFTKCGAPVLATIEQIIGTNTSDCTPPGAALPDWADMQNYQSPPFWNGTVPGDFRTNYGSVEHSDKNCSDCPCTGVNGRPIFVQVNGVVLTDPTPADDGDTTFNIHTPGTDAVDLFMHEIHCEISQSWKAAGLLPTRAMPSFDAAAMAEQYAGRLIDVQGLVFADLSKVLNRGLCGGHSNSVWEIHPVTAWRLHPGT
jgi:hypothetical protein